MTRTRFFFYLTFSPDGRTLAVTSAQGEIGKLFLFDVPGRKLAKTISLGEDAIVRRPVFSPDGKWIAVAAAQVIPGERRRSGESPEDVPQPRLYLVNAAAGEVRETLVMPQCFPTSACFSPDGKTLATAGYGKVLLWDLGKPAGDDGSPSRK
jgi:Tol biopolymer transport system component